MRHLWILAFSLVIILSLLSSCSNNYKTIFVAPQKADCMGVAPQKCLQIKETASSDWEYFYDDIKDFNYQEGYTYKVKVAVKEVKNPPQDASSLVYTLVEVLSKEKANQQDKGVADTDLKKVVYTANTRGYSLRIELTAMDIKVYEQAGTAVAQSISTEEWQAIATAVQEIELSTINTLAAPSNDRARDAAKSAQVTITNNKGDFSSSIFDHKKPPPALETLVHQVLSITEGVD